jgi:hypothetical protein
MESSSIASTSSVKRGFPKNLTATPASLSLRQLSSDPEVKSEPLLHS